MYIQNNYQYTAPKTYSPNFTAIHPVRYFVKCADGDFYREISTAKVKTFQRKIVSWLNKYQNDIENLSMGKKIRNIDGKKPENANSQKFIDYFNAHDGEHYHSGTARSFYTENNFREAQAYILTGKDADLCKDEIERIGIIRHELKNRRNMLTNYYGISPYETDKYISSKDIETETDAKRDYYNKMRALINEELRIPNPKNWTLDLFFEPIIRAGKDIKYKLVKVNNQNFDI